MRSVSLIAVLGQRLSWSLLGGAIFLSCVVLMPQQARAVCGPWPCGGQLPSRCDDPCDPPINTLEEGLSCLLDATTFMGGGNGGPPPSQRLTGITFDELLPSRYVSDAYNETQVARVIEFAQSRIVDPLYRCQAEQLLFEASLRQASAHGMFADDRLLRALDAQATDALPSLSGEPEAAGALLIDSRACEDSGRLCNEDRDCDPGKRCRLCSFAGNYACYFDSGSFEKVCNGPGGNCCETDADCPFAVPGIRELCAPCDIVGPKMCASDCEALNDMDRRAFGAVQEYRRGEQALVDAAISIRDARGDSGFQRFQDLDALSGCGGKCASTLLLRFGANKARAQSLRLERLYSRAITKGWVPTALTCKSDKESCFAHDDCTGTGNRCGSDDHESAYVLAYGAASEALAEGAAAQAVYPTLIRADVLSINEDLGIQQQQLEEIASRLNALETGLTPFGLPSDFVPFITDFGMNQFGCYSCTGSNGDICNSSATYACFSPLLDDLDKLYSGAGTVNGAAYIEAMTDSMRKLATTRDGMRAPVESTLKRMFGEPDNCRTCPATDPSCQPCTEQDFRAARCIETSGFQPDLCWRIAGRKCFVPELGVPPDLCDAPDADGEFEIAIHDVLDARARIEDKLDAYDFTAEQEDQIRRQVLKRRQIIEDECESVLSTIQWQGNVTELLIREKQQYNNSSKWEAFGSAVSGITSSLAKAPALGGKAGKAEVSAASGAAVSGVLSAGVNIVAGGLAQAEANTNADQLVDVEARAAAAQSQGSYRIQAAQCVFREATLDLDADDALFDLVQRRFNLELEILELERQAAAAMVRLVNLAAGLKADLDRLDEAERFDAIWNENEFRTALNFRLLALKDNLDKRSRFRAAQALTWLMLRTAAYDLVRPDFRINEKLFATDLRLGECLGRCSSSHLPCGEPGDCQADEQCELGSSCNHSLQAVFGADSISDLRALRSAAKLDTDLSKGGVHTPCGANGCSKRISLKRIFVDPLSDEPPRTLGEVLRQLPPLPNGRKALHFGISLTRGFEVCPLVPGARREDGSISSPFNVCSPGGVAGLLHDSDVDRQTGRTVIGSGQGTTLTDNTWGQRFLKLNIGLSYTDSGAAPDQTVCRDATTGEVINKSLNDVSKEAYVDACRTLCESLGRSCSIRAILTTTKGGINAVLRQAGTSVMRTREAERTDKEGGMPARDSLQTFRMREFDDGFDAVLDEEEKLAKLSPVKWDLVIEKLADSPPDVANILGFPVAGSDWVLELAPDLQADPAEFDAVFDSIDDIELNITYQAFGLN